MPQSAPRAVPAVLALGVCVSCVLGACDVTIRDGNIQDVSVHARASQEWSREYALNPGGVVEVVNGSGSIEAVAGRPGVADITAVFEARAMSDARAREILRENSV
jgi:hypothetical protein